MARSRNIKPGFFQNDLLAECDPLARILFAGTWTIVDRAGRMEDRPKKIKAMLLPYDNCDIEELLTQLTDRSFLERYEVENVKYFQVVNFNKHQNPHKAETKSTLPPPDMNCVSTVQAPCKHSSNRADSLNPITDSLNPITDTDKRKVKTRARSTPFAPPSLNEVRSYSQEKNLNIDAEQFIDFYQSKGWVVGKTKMKDWKAAARRAKEWCHKGGKEPQKRANTPTGTSGKLGRAAQALEEHNNKKQPRTVILNETRSLPRLTYD